MTELSPDTSPEAEAIIIEAYRNMTPSQKVARILAANRFTDALARADVVERFAGASEREIRLRVASRRIPRHLMVAAFGWDPNQEEA